jgi:DNA polymerase-1
VKRNLGEELSKHVYDVILVDGMNVSAIHFHSKKMLSYKGKPTGMLYGVMRLVRTLKDTYPATPVVFLWEGRKNRRKGMYAEYKGNRLLKRDQGFVESLADVSHALPMSGVAQCSHPRLEADDLAGYFSTKYDRALLVSNDKDWWQFAQSGKVDVMVKAEILTYEKLQMRVGFAPEKIPLMKILKGDSSDNIPGIPRFPMKLAIQAINKCKDPYNLIPIVDLLSPKWGKVLQDNEDILKRNADLIVYHEGWVSVGDIMDVDAKPDASKLAQFLRSRGIKSLAQGWFS